MLAATRWLFMAEIENEVDGGVSPATLGSALESLEIGYNPDSNGGLDMTNTEKELNDLIKQHGEDKELEDLISNKDWEDRASGVLQDQAYDEMEKHENS